MIPGDIWCRFRIATALLLPKGYSTWLGPMRRGLTAAKSAATHLVLCYKQDTHMCLTSYVPFFVRHIVPFTCVQSWKLKFGDMVEIWRACGAIWLAKQDGDSESVGDDDNDDDADGGVHLRRNLRPALNVVEACLRKG